MHLKMCGKIFLLVLMLRFSNIEAQDDTDASSESEEEIQVQPNKEGIYVVVSSMKL